MPPSAKESAGVDLGVVGDDAGLVLQRSVVAMGARYPRSGDTLQKQIASQHIRSRMVGFCFC